MREVTPFLEFTHIFQLFLGIAIFSCTKTMMLWFFDFVIQRKDDCATGGVSELLDGYGVVEEMRENHPAQLEILSETPIEFKNRVIFDK